MLLTFIKLSFVIKIFVSSISKWSFCTGFTVIDSTKFEIVRFLYIFYFQK